MFNDALENIDRSAVRNEYKLWMYSNYLLPSKRFLLTVHNINHTNLQKLDTFTDKFIKKWAGVPFCATNVVIHLQAGMNIRSISELYMEAHCISHARTRLLGDGSVNHVLDCTVERERRYVREKKHNCRG